MMHAESRSIGISGQAGCKKSILADIDSDTVEGGGGAEGRLIFSIKPEWEKHDLLESRGGMGLGRKNEVVMVLKVKLKMKLSGSLSAN